MDPKNETTLLSEYNDESWQKAVLEIMELQQFLSGCIIRSDYRVSDDLNSAIILSEAGNRFVRELGKNPSKDKVTVKDAKLMCLLEFAHLDPLIDPLKINAQRLADAITAQIKSGEILLPYVHGPLLYRKAAHLFPDRRRYLSISETLKLLDGTPVGVFQSGSWTSGPYGLLRSDERRYFGATRRLPLQHCSEISCNALHVTVLATDDAPINAQRPLADKYFEAQSELPSEWSKYFAEISKDQTDELIYDDYNRSTIFALIGDAFDVSEKRRILGRLIDDHPGPARARLSKLGLRGSTDAIIQELPDAECTQLILLFADSAVWTATDGLVLDGEILVPVGEIRPPVMHKELTSGFFEVRVELSNLGLRCSAPNSVALLRLRRLISRLFPLHHEESKTELGWALRNEPGGTLEAKVDEFLRVKEPRSILDSLVVSRRKSAVQACDEVALDLNFATRPDLTDLLMWKLGFQIRSSRQVNQEYWPLHHRLRHAAQSATVSTLIDYQHVREASVSYFVKLEELLSEALAYVTWALTNDHVTDKKPYQFDLEHHRSRAFALLSKGAKEPVELGEKPTIYPLIRGFAHLAAYLEQCVRDSSLYVRALDQLPRFADKTEIQKFPFRSTVPFLDLTELAKRRIIDGLVEVANNLDKSNIAQARNDQLHYRTSQADLDGLLAALETVQATIQKMENLGFIREVFVTSRSEVDSWGRRTILMNNDRGAEIVMGRPSMFEYLQLPAVRHPQYIFSSAIFAEPNDMLRFRAQIRSSFAELWEDFPLRREKTGLQTVRQDSTERTAERVERDLEAT